MGGGRVHRRLHRRLVVPTCSRRVVGGLVELLWRPRGVRRRVHGSLAGRRRGAPRGSRGGVRGLPRAQRVEPVREKIPALTPAPVRLIHPGRQGSFRDVARETDGPPREVNAATPQHVAHPVVLPGHHAAVYRVGGNLVHASLPRGPALEAVALAAKHHAAPARAHPVRLEHPWSALVVSRPPAPVLLLLLAPVVLVSVFAVHVTLLRSCRYQSGVEERRGETLTVSFVSGHGRAKETIFSSEHTGS
mmetsp:Transcript_2986/g.12911  ORF Transcript_2986/g.12911 Transcript_2986/m.12911 type:complete len:247 (+) Transcript_2986:577-1317(+)